MIISENKTKKNTLLNLIRDLLLNDLENSGELLWAISLKLWHTERNDIAMSAGELLFNMQPWHSLLSKNINFYLHKLQYKNIIIDDGIYDNGYFPMNTTLAKYGNKFVGFVRTVNYILDKNNGLISGVINQNISDLVKELPYNNYCSSLTWMYIFEKTNSKINIIKKIKISNQNELYLGYNNNLYSGSYEDVRVLPQMINNNEWLFLANRPIYSGNKQFIGKIKYDDTNDTAEFIEYKQISYGTEREKNWVFYNLEHNNVDIIYKWFPLSIIKYNLDSNEFIVKTEKYKYNNNHNCKLFDYDSYRGGCCPIKIRNRIISVVHQVTNDDTCIISNYMNRFIEINENYDK